MKYLSLKLSGVAAALCLAAAVAPASAQASTTFDNGSFAAGVGGLQSWHTYGDVIVLGVRRSATLTNASVDFADDEDLPEGFNNRSGTPAIDFGGTNYLAGIPVTSLDITGFAAEGSAIRQDFISTGGGIVTVSFDWNFFTNELPPAAGGFPDFGFVALNGAVVDFVTTTVPRSGGRFTHTFVDAAHLLPVFAGSTLYTPRPGQQVSLVFGVVDVGDFSVTSELRIDNIAVSAVPEPEAFAMLAAGLGLIGWKLRRRQQARGTAAV